MQKIPLKRAQQGMVIAQPVQREDGLVLVGPDTELTEAIINRLIMAGIGSITVKGNPVMGESGGNYQSLLDGIDPMFRNLQDDKFMISLQGVLKKYFQTKLDQARAAKEAAEETAVATDEAPKP